MLLAKRIRTGLCFGPHSSTGPECFPIVRGEETFGTISLFRRTLGKTAPCDDLSRGEYEDLTRLLLDFGKGSMSVIGDVSSTEAQPTQALTVSDKE